MLLRLFPNSELFVLILPSSDKSLGLMKMCSEVKSQADLFEPFDPKIYFIVYNEVITLTSQDCAED